MTQILQPNVFSSTPAQFCLLVSIVIKMMLFSKTLDATPGLRSVCESYQRCHARRSSEAGTSQAFSFPLRLEKSSGAEAELSERL